MQNEKVDVIKLGKITAIGKKEDIEKIKQIIKGEKNDDNGNL